MHELSGSCHCGAIEVRFYTSVPLEQLEVRACQCGFCRRHGAATVTDAAGRLVIRARKHALVRYRFGAQTADFLLCGCCGVYVAAVLSQPEGTRATLNIRCLLSDRVSCRAATPVFYDDEAPDDRIARRMVRWTPAELVRVSDSSA